MDGTPDTDGGEVATASEETAISQWDPAEYLRNRIPQAQYNRRSFDRGFYRNCLFYLGQQWIKYSRSAQQWRPIAVPDWFPKQITNKLAVAVDLMTSVFLQSDPQSIYEPGSDEFADIAAARAAGDIEKVIDKEVNQSDLEGRLAKWIVLTGNGFVLDGYDNDVRHGTKFVSDMACLDCIKHIPAEEAAEGCPYCGGSNLMEARDEDGQPVGKDLPIGRMFSEACGPFEIHFDLVSESLEASPYVYRARTYPIAVLQDMFPDHKKEIKADDAGIDSGMFYQTALAYITNGTSSTPGNYAGSVGSVDNVPRATLYHLWVRPTKALPQGGEALICGDATLWKGELCYQNERDEKIVPLTHFTFNKVPGRVFAKTPVDDAVFKQTQRNKIEAFIQLAMERTSNPTWLLPKGIGIDNITGEPGEKIWFNSFMNAKPERVAGSEIPGSVFRWLEALDFDIQDITHTRDVMRGMAPENTPTFGAAQLILDRAFAGFQDGLKSWGQGMNQVRYYRLCIWREYASDERTMMVLGKNREWEARKFSKDHMQGAVSVQLEEASVAPKSKAYDQLMVSQMIDKQMIDLSDPMVKMQAFSIFDMPQLIENLDLDIKDAQKEKEEFMKSGQMRPRAGIDNDVIHAMDHIRVAKSDEFYKWPPQAQQAWIQHALYHVKRNEDAQKAAQMNDPHVINAQAKLQQVQMELQGIAQEKAADVEHMKQRKAIDLQAHGVRKGLDLAVQIKKAQLTPHGNGANIS